MNDHLLSINGRGYDGSTNNMGEYAPGWSDSVATIHFQATENWGPANHGTNLRFSITPNGQLLQRTAMVVGATATGTNSVCILFTSGMRLLTTNGTNITDGGPCPF
jgi:hypothetical protein